jgi:hypothetical protein
LQRQNVQRRQKLWADAIFRSQQFEEGVDGFRQCFSLSVTVYYYYKRSPGSLPQQDGIEGLRGVGKAGKGRAIAHGEAANGILKGRMLAQVQKQIANGRMDQG